ncbi:helix-turn-helix domain-containing protein [Chromobacterium violaceum]|uniref:helix-turn-helix domain-containing protein n=1 Tax=Chromobacterium violaceum TaxID=536 RepID=UPI0035A6760A
MKLSVDYLREALEKLGEPSASKAAEKLGIHRNTMAQYLRGENIMDDYACIMVAQVLHIDGMEIIAAAQMEREKNQDRKAFWEDFRKKLGVKLGIAGLGWILIMGSLTPSNAYAAGIHANTISSIEAACQIYIMSNLVLAGFSSKPQKCW